MRDDNRLAHYCRQLDVLFRKHPGICGCARALQQVWHVYNHYAKEKWDTNPYWAQPQHRRRKNLTGLLDSGMSHFFAMGLPTALPAARRQAATFFGKYPFQVVPNAIDTARFAFDSQPCATAAWAMASSRWFMATPDGLPNKPCSCWIFCGNCKEAAGRPTASGR